jgi:hypothetical protein
MLHNLMFILYYLQHVSSLSNHPQGDKIQGNTCKRTITLETVTHTFLYTQSITALNTAFVHYLYTCAYK